MRLEIRKGYHIVSSAYVRQGPCQLSVCIKTVQHGVTPSSVQKNEDAVTWYYTTTGDGGEGIDYVRLILEDEDDKDLVRGRLCFELLEKDQLWLMFVHPSMYQNTKMICKA